MRKRGLGEWRHWGKWISRENSRRCQEQIDSIREWLNTDPSSQTLCSPTSLSGLWSHLWPCTSLDLAHCFCLTSNAWSPFRTKMCVTHKVTLSNSLCSSTSHSPLTWKASPAPRREGSSQWSASEDFKDFFLDGRTLNRKNFPICPTRERELGNHLCHFIPSLFVFPQNLYTKLRKDLRSSFLKN